MEAIDALREELLKRLDGNTSVCRYAAEHGLMCRGFARWNDRELREHYGWIVRRRPRMSRQELEAVADRWQLAQQELKGLPTSCDVEAHIHDMCGGWDDFSNKELARFLFEITGEKFIVV
jgi:hypothetical protein